jgi:hypothetical protein
MLKICLVVWNILPRVGILKKENQINKKLIAIKEFNTV